MLSLEGDTQTVCPSSRRTGLPHMTNLSFIQEASTLRWAEMPDTGHWLGNFTENKGPISTSPCRMSCPAQPSVATWKSAFPMAYMYIMYIQAHLCYGMHVAFWRQSQELVLCRQSCVGSHQACIQMPLLTELSRCLVSNFILLKVTEGAEGIYPVKRACLACFNSIPNTQNTPKSYCLSLLKEVKIEILKYFFTYFKRITC